MTGQAVPILRCWFDGGDGWVAERPAGLLAGRGDLGGLRSRADAGYRLAAELLAGPWVPQLR
jgi:hypothetical protein